MVEHLTERCISRLEVGYSDWGYMIMQRGKHTEGLKDC